MVCFHQNSQLLAVGSIEGLISVFDLKQAVRVHLLDAHPSKEKEKEAAAASSSHHKNPLPLPLNENELIGGITSLAFNEQGRLIAAHSNAMKTLYVWQLYNQFSFFGFPLRPQLLQSFQAPPGNPPVEAKIIWTTPKSIELVRGNAPPLSFAF
jgi:WD40 repeat protein